MPTSERHSLDELARTRLQLRRGENLFRHGDAFDALYALRNGFFKTSMCARDGREQITGCQPRSFQTAHNAGVLQVRHRHIRIVDAPALPRCRALAAA